MHSYIPSTDDEEVSIEQKFMEVVWRRQIARKNQRLVRPNCNHTRQRHYSNQLTTSYSQQHQQAPK